MGILLQWPTLSCQGEGNSDVERSWRARCRPHGVRDPSQDLGLTVGDARVVGGTVYFLATDEAELGRCGPIYYRHIRVRRVSNADGKFVFANMWNKATTLGSQYYLDAAGGYLFSEGMNNEIY